MKRFLATAAFVALGLGVLAAQGMQMKPNEDPDKMQKGGTRFWEISVPNGTYNVLIVAGDAAAFDSIYRINVEGVLIVNGTPSSGNRWISGSGTVTVTDGRLTVNNASGSDNNKICFIEITPQ